MGILLVEKVHARLDYNLNFVFRCVSVKSYRRSMTRNKKKVKCPNFVNFLTYSIVRMC